MLINIWGMETNIKVFLLRFVFVIAAGGTLLSAPVWGADIEAGAWPEIDIWIGLPQPG